MWGRTGGEKGRTYPGPYGIPSRGNREREGGGPFLSPPSLGDSRVCVLQDREPRGQTVVPSTQQRSNASGKTQRTNPSSVEGKRTEAAPRRPQEEGSSAGHGPLPKKQHWPARIPPERSPLATRIFPRHPSIPRRFSRVSRERSVARVHASQRIRAEGSRRSVRRFFESCGSRESEGTSQAVHVQHLLHNPGDGIRIRTPCTSMP